MLITFFGCSTVCMWAILATFRGCMLPPSSWSKCIGSENICIYIILLHKTTGGGASTPIPLHPGFLKQDPI
jgi:hypothetical protein